MSSFFCWLLQELLWHVQTLVSTTYHPLRCIYCRNSWFCHCFLFFLENCIKSYFGCEEFMRWFVYLGIRHCEKIEFDTFLFGKVMVWNSSEYFRFLLGNDLCLYLLCFWTVNICWCLYCWPLWNLWKQILQWKSVFMVP